jgi:periplasmic copper chaperone A
MMTFKTAALGLAAMMILTGCNPKDESVAGTDAATVTETAETDAAPVAVEAGQFLVAGASVRKPPGGRDVTAGYIIIDNPGAADRLIGASSPMVGSIELHTHTMADGMMQMRKVDGFDLPTGGTLTLASGGDHLMLFGVKPELASAETIPVTLTFEKAGAVEVSFAVTDGSEAAEMDHSEHEGHGR